jgi:hypothetical protein
MTSDTRRRGFWFKNENFGSGATFGGLAPKVGSAQKVRCKRGGGEKTRTHEEDAAPPPFLSLPLKGVDNYILPGQGAKET